VTHILRPGKAPEKTPKGVIPPTLCEISQNASRKKRSVVARDQAIIYCDPMLIYDVQNYDYKLEISIENVLFLDMISPHLYLLYICKYILSIYRFEKSDFLDNIHHLRNIYISLSDSSIPLPGIAI
jgi:hypothetical protein